MHLSICIPTYNRQPAVSAQVAFLMRELNGCNSIEIIVSDNASTDDTFGALTKIKFKGFSYYRHEQNAGILGNIKRLFAQAKGEYVWFLGDDDILLPGIIKEIVDKILSGPDLIFLNHNIENAVNGVIDSPNLFEELKINSAVSFLANIPSKRFGQLMFMSAAIHKKERLSEVINLSDNVAAPLNFALNGIQFKKIELIKRVFLKNMVGNESWSSEAVLVFGKYVPSIIIKYILRGSLFGFNVALFRAWLRVYWKHYFFSRLSSSARVFIKKISGRVCSKRK